MNGLQLRRYERVSPGKHHNHLLSSSEAPGCGRAEKGSRGAAVSASNYAAGHYTQDCAKPFVRQAAVAHVSPGKHL